MSQINVLTTEERARFGCTHEIIVDYTDLVAFGGSSGTVTVTVPAGSWVKGGPHVLENDFTDGGATISTITYTVGDGTDADLFMTSTEVESTATEVDYKVPTPGSGAAEVAEGKVYTSADTLDLAFTANTTMNGLTAGKLHYFFTLIDLDEVKG